MTVEISLAPSVMTFIRSLLMDLVYFGGFASLVLALVVSVIRAMPRK